MLLIEGFVKVEFYLYIVDFWRVAPTLGRVTSSIVILINPHPFKASCLYCAYTNKKGYEMNLITLCILRSQRAELNRGPTDYESVALPLSYAGLYLLILDSALKLFSG